MNHRHFVALAFGFGVAAVLLVSYNRSQAQTLALKVTQADSLAQDTTAQQAALSTYVQQHMQTSTSVFLKGSYDRAAAAAKAAAQSQANGQVYAAAQASCDKKGVDSIRQANCVQAYVAAHSQAMPNPQAAVMPTVAQFSKAFNAPAFTTDTAGILILAALASLITAGYLKFNRQ